MSKQRLRFLVLPVLAAAALLYVLPYGNRQSPPRATADPAQQAPSTGRVLVAKSFDSYSECDETATAAAKELKERGVRTALAARNALAGSTLYKVYYPDGTTGQITCRSGELVHEIW